MSTVKLRTVITVTVQKKFDGWKNEYAEAFVKLKNIFLYRAFYRKDHIVNLQGQNY
jgi:hypothetical protein